MKSFIGIIFLLLPFSFFAQNKTRALTAQEYQKAKTFVVKDLDNDTYVKFDNQYILDRYENKKPYFITGDDGLKKRIDLYKLLAKDSMQELGMVVFYTTETGKKYTICLPGLTAPPTIWETYFTDIHAIDKEEKNFVLKLSYVLSKELSYQAYKNLNANKDISKEQGTYGNDICFPGNTLVKMKDGSMKAMKDIQQGDVITTVDPVTHQTVATVVESLAVHEAKNYAITHITLYHAKAFENAQGNFVQIDFHEINATPNHPILTHTGEKKAGDITPADEIFCIEQPSGKLVAYKILSITENADGIQKVYNIQTHASTLVVNGVLLLQKSRNP